MNIPSFTWIEIKEGNPLPELEEKVLFKFDTGDCGYYFRGMLSTFWFNRVTHWMKILQPEEMKSQSTEQ